MPHVLDPPLPYWLLIHLLIVPHLALVLPVLYPHLASVLHSLFHHFKLPLATRNVRELPICLAQELKRLLLTGADLLALLSNTVQHIVPLLLPSACWDFKCCHCLVRHYLARMPWSWTRLVPAVDPRP